MTEKQTRLQFLQTVAASATEWRRELHQHPQTMYEETYASSFVSHKLHDWGIRHETGIAQTGVVASIAGSTNRHNRSVALRADMDALDILEASNQPWMSTIPGKMHGCGHDGHTATLLAVAKYLNEFNDFDGTVQLIFQPAEEGGRGSFRMLQEGLLDRFPFQEIYGFHNWPGLPRGVFAIRPGPMLAAADTFKIALRGVGGHAAMPHLTHDVVPATAQLITALQTLISRDREPMSPAVLSITNVSAGSGAVNVTGDSSFITGTVRTFSAQVRDLIEKRMSEIAAGIASAFGLTSETLYTRIVDPVVNDEEATKYCRSAALAISGESNLRDFEPIMGGEDFGGFLERRPGAFIAVGQMEIEESSPHNRSLHSPFYDFNDKIIPIVASYFIELVQQRLAPKD